MEEPLFKFPSYLYEVQDWDFKKKGLLNRINKGEFTRTPPLTFETDRDTAGKLYVKYFEDFLNLELSEFCKEAKVSCRMSDAWCVRYEKGDYQSVHNHRSWGFSGVLYVEYDSKVHTPTRFIQPWQDPRNDTVHMVVPQDIKEGSLFIFPSVCLHHVDPNNTRKRRTVISFDLLPELPRHQSLNRNV